MPAANSFFDWASSLVRFVRRDTARSGDVNSALDEVSTGFTAVEVKTNAAIKLPDGETASALAAAASRKGKLLSFNASTGAPETEVAVAGVATVTANIASIVAVAAIDADVTTAATNIAAIVAAPTHASNASSSASAASSSASAAASSASSAAGSVSTALAYLNDMKGRYFGGLSADPATDPLGAAINAGDIYFNTTTDLMRVYDGATWANVPNTLENPRPVWVKKSTTYAMVSGDAIYADTSGGAWTATLPANPSALNYVYLADPSGSHGSNNLTLARNGSKIMGLAEDLVCDIPWFSGMIVYIDATDGWRVL